jgi:hypothetical protein
MDAVRVKVAVYGHFAETGIRPTTNAVARRTGMAEERVLAAYRTLRAQRLLLLEPDGATIRMAPPFSGVPTQHRVEVGEVSYFANCAWDARRDARDPRVDRSRRSLLGPELGPVRVRSY